ncbi:hypothetical protein P3T76_001785 [Phytophthora citrophthora]|uniref:Mucin-like protein n=1 Tax=Phytophthora citrophthora TaxID=4793 RepID=A0AAD9GWT8_9STRA|nr:hypothetical protein P3T76_001785 [Phytophthora citrophthora]
MDVSSLSVSASGSGSDESLLTDDDLLGSFGSDDSASDSYSGSEDTPGLVIAEYGFNPGSIDYSASDSYSASGSEEFGFYSGSIDSSSQSGSEEYGEFYSGSFDYSESYSGLDDVDCTDISVARDATYCIKDPLCSGDGEEPAGYGCPLKGDVAVSDCVENVRSFLNGDCVATLDSICHRLDSGAWGCVWEDEVVDTTGGAATDCTVVTVEGDATFCISGSICSGDGMGDRCPVSGDVAIGDCHDYLPSYSGGKCVAPGDAVCTQLDTGAWGCAWGNNGSAASYAVDNISVSTGGIGGGNSGELAVGVGVAAAVAGVIAAVFVAWSRKKRQHQHQHAEDSGYVMEPMTPPGLTRGNAAFHRV